MCYSLSLSLPSPLPPLSLGERTCVLAELLTVHRNVHRNPWCSSSMDRHIHKFFYRVTQSCVPFREPWLPEYPRPQQNISPVNVSRPVWKLQWCAAKRQKAKLLLTFTSLQKAEKFFVINLLSRWKPSTTLCLKNDPTLKWSSSKLQGSILMILGKNI